MEQIPRNSEKLLSFQRPPFSCLGNGTNLFVGIVQNNKDWHYRKNAQYSTQDKVGTTKQQEKKRELPFLPIVLLDSVFWWNFLVPTGKF